MRGEAGVVGANLVIVLAFALYAVIQLSRTTLAANQIRDRVDVIESTVEPIDEDLTNVPKLDETNQIAADILAAVQPLNAQADSILANARSIDSTVSGILGNANSINNSVRGIRGTVSALTPVVTSINNGVAHINGQADRAIELVRAIQGDTGSVLAHVGTGGPGGHSAPGGKGIHGHANSIDCSPAFPPNTGCER